MFFTLTLGDSYFPFLAYSCFPITKSALLRLKELLGQPGAAEGLQSLHVMADLAIMAHFNGQN